MSNDTFKERRKFQHEICDAWREFFGKDKWVQVIGGDNFYFDPPCTTELQIRESLINRSVNELDSILLSTKLNIEAV